jgi:hypothetical protein
MLQPEINFCSLLTLGGIIIKYQINQSKKGGVDDIFRESKGRFQVRS